MEEPQICEVCEEPIVGAALVCDSCQSVICEDCEGYDEEDPCGIICVECACDQ